MENYTCPWIAYEALVYYLPKQKCYQAFIVNNEHDLKWFDTCGCRYENSMPCNDTDEDYCAFVENLGLEYPEIECASISFDGFLDYMEQQRAHGCSC